MLGILVLAVVAVYLIIKIIISAVSSRQKISVEYKPPSEKKSGRKRSQTSKVTKKKSPARKSGTKKK